MLTAVPIALASTWDACMNRRVGSIPAWAQRRSYELEMMAVWGVIFSSLSSPRASGDGGTGRRAGFKFRCPSGRAGSTPARRTTHESWHLCDT